MGDTRNAIRRRGKVDMFPLAWALLRTQEAIQKDIIEFDEVALSYLALALDGLRNWGRHSLSTCLAAGLFNEQFHHSVAALTLASALRQTNASLGITDESRVQLGQKRSPDLYLNVTPTSRLSVEVKAPEAFRWPNAVPTVAQAAKVVDGAARAARAQMTGERGGVLVIAAFSRHAPWRSTLDAAVGESLVRRRVSSRIAQVWTIFIMLDDAQLQRFALPMKRPRTLFQFHPNPRYEGDIVFGIPPPI
jgi:hypothetical protein